MTKSLFVPQDKLEAWIEKGEVSFDGEILTLIAKGGVSYVMAPAVNITSILDGKDDLGLLNKHWAVQELEKMGAEHFHDSVIAGETAYQCEVGFVGKEQLSEKPPSVAPAPPAEAPVAPLSSAEMVPQATAEPVKPAPPPAPVPAPASAPAPAPNIPPPPNQVIKGAPTDGAPPSAVATKPQKPVPSVIKTSPKGSPLPPPPSPKLNKPAVVAEKQEASPPSAKPAEQQKPDDKNGENKTGEKSDMELLTSFLLDNL